MLSTSVFGAMQWHIPVLKHLFHTELQNMYFKSEEVLVAWKACVRDALIFRLKLQYSHVLCIADCAWINLGSWGMWLEMQEAILQAFSGVSWVKVCLSCVLHSSCYFPLARRLFISVKAVGRTPLLNQRNQDLCFKITFS